MYSSLLQHLVPPEESDARNVVLEVRVGVGGEWAGAFAMDLLRMYQGFCEQQGWQFEVSGVGRCGGTCSRGLCICHQQQCSTWYLEVQLVAWFPGAVTSHCSGVDHLHTPHPDTSIYARRMLQAWMMSGACWMWLQRRFTSRQMLMRCMCLPAFAPLLPSPLPQVLEMSTTELGNLKYAVASVAGHGSYGEQPMWLEGTYSSCQQWGG